MTEHKQTEHKQMDPTEENRQQLRSTAQQAGDAAATATTRAKDAAGAATEQTKQQLGQAADTAKQEAARVGEEMRQQADSMVAEQKNMAADRLGTLADSLRQTGRQLRDQQEDQMGRYAEIAADQVDSAADFLRNRNTGDLFGEVQRLARRSPEAFVAGSLAVGFLIGRFVKGPSRSAMNARRQQQGSEQYGQQYNQQYGQQYGQGYTGSIYGQSQSSQGQGIYGQGSQGSFGTPSTYGQSYRGTNQGMYRGSDNPAEGVTGSGERADNRSRAYQGRYETSGMQGNAYQQGGAESRGYQAEGAADSSSGPNAYQTGPDMTPGSDTDYPRYDPSYTGGGSIPEANTESTDESTTEGKGYTPTSRR